MSLQIATGAVVCVEADIRGDVTFGSRTIVHPCAKIFATNGPIIIGDGNIIEELVLIENNCTLPLTIGSNNVFEVGAIVHAKSVGDNNVFETRCIVGSEVVVGSGCTFGAGTKITSSIPTPENSVLFGEPLRHRLAEEKNSSQALQIDFLSRVLPNYHHVRNPAAVIKKA
jgi:dynactin-6